MSIRADRRNWSRLDKVFPVLIESPLLGFRNCIARNISTGGIFLETPDPLPLGSPIRVYFALREGGGDGISAAGHVKNHYYLNYGSVDGPRNVTGMGVRFTEFDADGAAQLTLSLRESLQ